MKRWNPKRLLKAFKKAVTSIFICLVVFLPVLIAVVQWGGLSPNSDPRKVSSMQPLQTRAIDQTAAPIKPFEEPLITVTFDDGWESIYSDGLPLLNRYGIPTTQYVLSGVFDDRNYLTMEQIKAMQKAGHEIGCHSIDHADMTTLNAMMLQKQLKDCQDIFQNGLGTSVEHFASPYGSSNPQTIAAIRQYYRSHRNTNGDIVKNGVNDQDVNMRASFNLYNIHAITIRRDTTAAQLQQAIDYAVRNNGWLVLNYHNVEEDTSVYSLNKQSLEAQLAAISRSQARIVTMGQVVDVLAPRNGTR